MSRKMVCVKSQDGLYSRTAVMFCQSANNFQSAISLKSADGRTAQAKSLLQILKLGINHGQSVEITAEGNDAEEAVKALTEVIS